MHPAKNRLVDLWQVVLPSIEKCEKIPKYVKELLPRRILGSDEWKDEDEYLATLGNGGYIAIRCIEITQSYNDFLKLQISLCARGIKWNEVLEKRLNAYLKHVGKFKVCVDVFEDNIGIDMNISVLAEPPYSILTVETHEQFFKYSSRAKEI